MVATGRGERPATQCPEKAPDVISLQPTLHAVRKMIGRPSPDLRDLAGAERWMLAPSVRRHVPSAAFLPGQLDRIRGAEFGAVAEVVRDFRGGFEAVQPPTMAYRLKDVDLVDGVLYKRRAVRHLRRRSRRLPFYARPTEMMSGAIYDSSLGNRWFGNWLSDDCLTYALAAQFGAPVTARTATWRHAASYEKLLGHRPKRLDHIRFDELTLFDDMSHNDGKWARAEELRARLLEGQEPIRHPGAFLLRGASGDRRVLRNELAIAEKLAERGFSIVDPSLSSVDEIVRICAGAQVVAGVEGSHLVHGLAVMSPDAALLVIQPPHRVVSVLKMITDRQGQRYAFVVGSGGCDAFEVAWDDVARTLDLLG